MTDQNFRESLPLRTALDFVVKLYRSFTVGQNQMLTSSSATQSPVIKVLYVSPFAHRPGHYYDAARIETKLLSKVAKVTLLCYDSTDKHFDSQVERFSVRLPRTIHVIGRFSNFLALLLEDLLMLYEATRISRRNHFDVIHVRDGDPFVLPTVLMTLICGVENWAISLVSDWKRTSVLYSRFVGSRVWSLVFRSVIRRKNFLFHCQNKAMLHYYSEEFCGGALRGRTIVVPLFVITPSMELPTREEARLRLGLPSDRPIFLSIGAHHSGKVLKPLFELASSQSDWLLVHIGAYIIGKNFWKTWETSNSGMVARFRRFSTLEESLYYLACDAVILSYRADFAETASTLWRAAAFRKPVIASDSASLGQLVKTYNLGLIFTPGDKESMKHAIESFNRLSSVDLEVFAQGLDLFASEFSEQKVTATWSHIHSVVFSGSRGRDSIKRSFS